MSAHGGMILRRNQGQKCIAQQLLPGSTEIAAVGIVDERDRPVGEPAADQIGLVLDDGPVSRLASLQRILLPLDDPPHQYSGNN